MLASLNVTVQNLLQPVAAPAAPVQSAADVL
jgi:hypothetical protein